MGRLDFHLEFQSEVEYVEEALLEETAVRLRELAQGHNDMIGASVALEELTRAGTPHVYQVRVVVYIRPDNVVAVEKAETLELALKGAVDAVERQVRKLREKVGEPWQRPPSTPDTLDVG
jgi:ribosome-associated translation inhibitor RaiA